MHSLRSSFRYDIIMIHDLPYTHTLFCTQMLSGWLCESPGGTRLAEMYLMPPGDDVLPALPPLPASAFTPPAIGSCQIGPSPSVFELTRRPACAGHSRDGQHPQKASVLSTGGLASSRSTNASGDWGSAVAPYMRTGMTENHDSCARASRGSPYGYAGGLNCDQGIISFLPPCGPWNDGLAGDGEGLIS